MNEIKSGPLKAEPSPFGPITPDGRRAAEAMVAESQVWFLGLVKSRRGIDTAAVPGLEQGRIFSGREAITHKLVDEIGGEAEAVAWLESRPGVPKGLSVRTWRPAPARGAGLSGWLGSALHEVWQGAAGGNTWLSEIDTMRTRLSLDGLVSVWQPHEK